MTDSAIVERALRLLEKALALGGLERQAFLERCSAGDPELRRELESLLRHEQGLAIASSASDLPDPEIPARSRADDRYELGPEIARGGMAVIYRAHDRILEREVAVKVIGDAYRDRPEAVHRFLAEARITAWLQHPGIAPLYELGRLEDGGPFIAMKLIKGETLAQLLSQRPSPGEGLLPLLEIFTRVCQTIAFAHAHYVIHRDLKPENIMVGEFGEVQVLDWGLAKVLDPDPEALASPAVSDWEGEVDTRDHDASPPVSPVDSRVGSVVGTPDYMPPEQGLGLPSMPTDVFSLGAMLCEILTGSPPYTDSSPTETPERSIRVDLDDALDRISRTGVDTELACIATSCLEVDPVRRPRDAGQVAGMMRGYLRSAETRAQEARVRAARAQEATRQERRRRLLTLALGVSVAAALTVAIAVIVLINERTANAEKIRVADRLRHEEEFDELLSQGYAQLHVGSPAEAAACFEKAMEVPGASMLEGVAGLALSHANDPDAGLAFLDRLPDARELGWARAYLLRRAGRHREAATVSQSLATPKTAFGFFFLGGEALEKGHGGDASSFAEALTLLTKAVFYSDSPRAHYIAQRAHAAGHSADPTAAAECADVLTSRWARSATAWFWAGLALVHTDPDRSIAAFEEALRLRPRDPLALNGLGLALRENGKPQEAKAAFKDAISADAGFQPAHLNLALLALQEGLTEEAIQGCEAAVRLRPRDAEARYYLGRALAVHGRSDDAIIAYRAAIRIFPQHAHAHNDLGTLLASAGLPSEAINHFREAIRAQPAHVSAHENLGRARLENGDPDGAATAFEEAIRLGSPRPETRCALGWALHEAGRPLQALSELREGHRPVAIPGYWSDRLQTCEISVLRAARAAARQASEHEESEATRLRQRAHDCLKALLIGWQVDVASNEAATLERIHGILGAVKKSREFAGLRDEDRRSELPSTERERWRALWSLLEDLHARSKE